MGIISQIETMGLVDGPGVRVVVFLSGCTLRCLYCHNPEMWEMSNGYEITPAELVKKIKKYQNYFGKEGGVTFSGGEPLLQPDFLIETMKLCHKNQIHTCLDTSGVGTAKDEEVLKHTDLVILDVKAIDNDNYQKITNQTIDKYNNFLHLCQKLNKPLWIRQVIVPNINDTKEDILKLKKYLKNIKNIEKIELLPYHTHGKGKYKTLNLKYPLEETTDMDIKKLKELQQILES